LAAALGIGLLIGIERERIKGQGRLRAAAGIRTFALASLLGALSLQLGHEILVDSDGCRNRGAHHSLVFAHQAT
jgi:hypothetical protein